jgi:copper transport outer membrane protein MctB
LISFRYHLVSIVAVFLALAVGVVMGTTVIKQGVIDSLQNQTNRLLGDTHALEDQVKDLQRAVGTWEAFGRAVQPMLVSGQLAGNDAVIVTQAGVDASEVDGVRNVLEQDGQAGAHVVAVLEVTSKMGLADSGARSELAQIVGGSPSDSASRLSERMASALAVRLGTGPGSLDNDPNDFLRQLIRGRFVAMRAGSPTDVGGAEQSLILLSGGSGQPSVDPQSFLVPLAKVLVQGSRSVVAAETTDTNYPFVSILRNDPTLDDRLVTVDDADTPMGRVALVLGLRDLIVEPGRGGDYGVHCGSCGLIPTA